LPTFMGRSYQLSAWRWTPRPRRTFLRWALRGARARFVRGGNRKPLFWKRMLLAREGVNPLAGRDLLIGAVYGVSTAIWLEDESANFLLLMWGSATGSGRSCEGSRLGALRHALERCCCYVVWAQTIDSLGNFFILVCAPADFANAWIAGR